MELSVDRACDARRCLGVDAYLMRGLVRTTVSTILTRQNCIRSALLIALLLPVRSWCAEPEYLDLSKFDCGPCMPANAGCSPPRIPEIAVIAEVSGAEFKGYLRQLCPEFHAPCEEYTSHRLYAFRHMNFLRNDFRADKKTKFSAFYYYPVAHPDRWGGIHLREDRPYLIVAQGRGSMGVPEINFACELARNTGETP